MGIRLPKDDQIIKQGLFEFREELKQALNKKIQLITAARPPAGRPPNITGVLVYVGEGTIQLKLKSEEEMTTDRIGVYQINHIIGFVPAKNEDHQEGGCSDH